MTLTDAPVRSFEPGTTGWTVADLDRPEIERGWFNGRYELVEGVLTIMPPAYFAGGSGLVNLIVLLKNHLKAIGVSAKIAVEVDIVISDRRLAVADAAMLLPEDQKRQDAAAAMSGRFDLKRARIFVPPTLVIESVSPGHEDHDRSTKRRWYAEFGVPHYWVLDAFARSLQCLALDGGQYLIDAGGRELASIQSSLFPGLAIPLAELWSD